MLECRVFLHGKNPLQYCVPRGGAVAILRVANDAARRMTTWIDVVHTQGSTSRDHGWRSALFTICCASLTMASRCASS
jgi:hypothetical protein